MSESSTITTSNPSFNMDDARMAARSRCRKKTPSIRAPSGMRPRALPAGIMAAVSGAAVSDEDRRCWTCRLHDLPCDMGLPVCKTCRNKNRSCGGYGIQINWSAVNITANPRSSRPPSLSEYYRLPQLGLPSQQSFYIQHLSKNLARIALAIDYEGNGYRKWIRVAESDSLLLDAILAVTIAHYSRWQQRQEHMNESRVHYNRAMRQLRDRLQDPVMVQSESTLATMLFLISYEVFDGSNRWKRHNTGMLAWIKAFGSRIAVDPFLKTWISMINTQSALNTGIPVAPQVATWLAESSIPGKTSVIDPFFGCSANLPHLMLQASNLFIKYRTAAMSGQLVGDDTETELAQLARQLSISRVSLDEVPVFEIVCANRGEALLPVHCYFTEKEVLLRAATVAEIFRCAMLVYVLRILHPPSALAIPEIQETVQTVIDLLPLVPDVLGPGSNLGWAYVVIGVELTNEEQREYIWCRLQNLHSLAFQNVDSAEKVLKAAWKNRDEAHLGREPYRYWQDLMQSLNVEQILI